MLKIKSRRGVFGAAMALLMCAFLFASMKKPDVYGASGSLSIALSAQNLTVGQTVSVTINMSADEPIGYTVGVSYDASKLEYQGGGDGGGGGRVDLVSEGDGSSASFARTLTFKAIDTGSASVSASGSYGGYNSLSSITPSPAGVTINISAPGGSSGGEGGGGNETLSGSDDNYLKTLEISPGTLSPAFSKGTTSYTVQLPEDTKSITVSAIANDSKAKVTVSHNNDLEPGANKTYIVVTAENGTQRTYVLNVNCGEVKETEASGVSVMGKKYTFGTKDTMKDAEVPEGFSSDTVTYQGEDVLCYKPESGKIILVWLIDETEAGQWFVYMDQRGEFAPFVELTCNGNRYAILTPDETIQAPEGYQATELSVKDQTVYGFMRAEDPEFYLVYVQPFEGEAGLYFYDVKEQTLQRYHSVDKVVTEVVAVTEEAATEAPLVTESDKEIRLHHICYVLCGILGILLIGWIVTVVVLKKQITPPVAEVHSEGESDE